MTDTLIETLKLSPALAVIVIIIFAFLKFLKELLASHASRTNEFINMVRELNDENIEARKHSREVIEKVTAEMARAAEMQEQNTEAVREMTRVLREMGGSN